MTNLFIQSLEKNDLVTLRKIPKGDLHNHATRGETYRILKFV